LPDPIQSSSPHSCVWLDSYASSGGSAESCTGPGPLACYGDETGPEPVGPGPVGQGGTYSASTQADSEPPTQGAHPEAVQSLCERRLATNDALCGFLGRIAAGRVGGSSVKQALIGGAIEQACVEVARWLETHAPGGACGKE
jgi:hypothetical protein